MASRVSLSILLFFASYVNGFKSYGEAVPVSMTQGHGLGITDKSPYTDSITLSPSQPFLTLDYGYDVAGLPFFDVASLSGPTQIEIKYAEGFYTLAEPQSDGPWQFVNQDSNSFRIETSNITSVGRLQSFFIQGGQRWETLRLLTDTEITFQAVGLNLSSAHTPASELPGHTSFSDDLYGQISGLGGIAAEVACVDAGNALRTWDITADGAYIRGQLPAHSALTQDFANYTLEFRTKIHCGGMGWRVAVGIAQGPIFNLNSEYPEGRTLLNTNRTLMPPNSIVFNYGQGFVVTEDTSGTGNEHFRVPFPIHEDIWYTISTTIMPEGYNISIDGHHAAFVPITEALKAYATASFGTSGSPYLGGIAFGPFQDQAAYVRDVAVTAHNGSVLYQNDMLSDAVPAEYGVATSIASVCLDGAKRDRLVWIGDFYHTVRIVGASTLRWDYIVGTFDYDFSWQKTQAPLAGLVPIDAPLGSRPEYADIVGSYGALFDYQDLFMAGIGHYFRLTGDVGWVQSRWENIKRLAIARLAFIDPHSGLMAGSSEFPEASYFLGPVNGSAPSALAAYTYQLLTPVAKAAGDHEAAERFANAAQGLRHAINAQLWNPALGTYSLSLDAPANYSLTAIALTILSGTANVTQTASMVERLAVLRCGVGYKTDSSTPCTDETQLAPNPSGFLLEALFKAHRDYGVSSLPAAKTLLDDLWAQMVVQDEYASGASWEYVLADGSPGLGDFTSLAHPWGGAPTYVLPEYLLGVTPTSPGFRTWQWQPLLGEFGLSSANGTVVTPFGEIVAGWEQGDDCWVLTVSSPAGTVGTLTVFGGFAIEHESGSMQSSVEVAGSKTIRVRAR